jgi:hypothetical protein
MGWNHAICEMCWYNRAADRGEPGREAVRLKEDHNRKCCYCGNDTTYGAFVREDPKSENLLCNKFHQDD